MKTTKIPFCESIPDSWDEIPNRYLFEEHSVKVGDKSSEYQLLSLTTSGVKEKDANAAGGKVPESYDNYQTVEKGDMIFCLFDLDCSAVFSGLSNYNGMITSAYDVFRPNPKYAEQHFLDYWFQYVFSNRYYKMYSKNIRYTVTREMFNGISTPVPPLAEQKKIGEFLDQKCAQIDALILNQERQIEKLKQYKQSLITEVVTKGLDPTVPLKDSGIEWIGKIPQGWSLNRLKYCASFNGETLNERESPERKIRYVEIGSVSLENGVEKIDEYLFKDAPSRARRITHIGDIVISTVRTYLKAIARISENNLIVSTGFCVISPNGKLSSEYMEFFCKSNTFCDYISSNSYGISYPAINATSLMDSHIISPPLQKQQEICSYIKMECKKIDALLFIKQSKIEKLNQYKKSLIYEYVTGKKEVSV